jgi:hypothetical protein
VLINIALQVSKKFNLTTEELSLKLDFDGLRGLVTPHLESVMVSFFLAVAVTYVFDIDKHKNSDNSLQMGLE